jgi:hypothetical protein
LADSFFFCPPRPPLPPPPGFLSCTATRVSPRSTETSIRFFS